MILKGSQRASGGELAVHLMRLDDNEHVSLHELRGFACDDLKGAFKEAEAASRGTKCRQYLFSLSLSPPPSARVPVADFESVIARIETRLGLEGQPRAIVFHEKEGRRHAHCVWSRIDAETMTARPLPFFKQKLMGLSRDLYLEHGWEMPHGIAVAGAGDPTNFSLAEWHQAKRLGIDPRQLKASLQDCWKRSDSLSAFTGALQDQGLFLARGDRRGHVVLDHTGEVWSLPRLLDLKTKEVRARLGDGADLRSVAETQKLIGERMTPAIRRHIADSKERFRQRAEKIAEAKAAMTTVHRRERVELDSRQRRDWVEETKVRAGRLPQGLVANLWQRLTGQYAKTRQFNEAEAQATRQRQDKERQEQLGRHLAERARLQERPKELRQTQAKELWELRSDIGRFLKLSQGRTPDQPRRELEQTGQDRTTPRRAQTLGLKLER